MYTTILWDLDNTLLNFNASEKYAFDTCMLQAGITPTPALLEAYSRLNLSFWKRLERGEITKETLLAQRFISYFEMLGISNVDIPLFKATYQELLGSFYEYLDDSLSLCRYLQRTHRQYIVTNGVAVTQRNKLKNSGLDQTVQDCFISEELGCDKPSPAFFEACFARIPDFKKEETLIVGDSLTSDMQGGRNAGIACCWYNPSHKRLPEEQPITHSISNLWELLPILGLPQP